MPIGGGYSLAHTCACGSKSRQEVCSMCRKRAARGARTAVACRHCGQQSYSAECWQCRHARERSAATDTGQRVTRAYDANRAAFMESRIAAYERWVQRYPNRPIDYDRALAEYLEEPHALAS